MRSQLLFTFLFPFSWWVIFLLLISRLSFFLFGFQLFNYHVSRSRSLYHSWGLLKFLDLKINVYHQIRRIFSYYFFKCFSLTLSSSSGAYTSWCCLTCLWGSVHFLHSFFLSILHIGKFLLIYMQVHWFAFLPTQICCWAHLGDFLF